jgi:tryptophan-rich sensory protein
MKVGRELYFGIFCGGRAYIGLKCVLHLVSDVVLGDFMKFVNWKVYAVSIVLAEIVGIISGFFSRDAMMVYGQMGEGGALAPPAIVFPIVWTILYGLMGISAARIWISDESDERTKAIIVYVAQLVVNFFWSIIFFNFEAYGVALLWIILLWFLIILMIRAFNQVDKVAARLQIPYLVWVTYATFITLSVYIMMS